VTAPTPIRCPPNESAEVIYDTSMFVILNNGKLYLPQHSKDVAPLQFCVDLLIGKYLSIPVHSGLLFHMINDNLFPTKFQAGDEPCEVVLLVPSSVKKQIVYGNAVQKVQWWKNQPEIVSLISKQTRTSFRLINGVNTLRKIHPYFDLF